MITVKNLMFQPLTFHLKGGEDNLHLGPRARKQIPRERVTPELEAAKRRGLVAMEDVAPPAKPEPKPEVKPATKRTRRKK